MGDLGKIIVATSFEWLPKVHKIAKSGHTALLWLDAVSRMMSINQSEGIIYYWNEWKAKVKRKVIEIIDSKYGHT